MMDKITNGEAKTPVLVQLGFPHLPRYGRSIRRMKDGTVYELALRYSTSVQAKHLKELKQQEPFLMEVKHG